MADTHHIALIPLMDTEAESAWVLVLEQVFIAHITVVLVIIVPMSYYNSYYAWNSFYNPYYGGVVIVNGKNTTTPSIYPYEHFQSFCISGKIIIIQDPVHTIKFQLYQQFSELQCK